MANNLTVTGNLAITGSSVFTSTVDLAGGALNTDLVTNFNADLLDGAELSTDGTLADNSDTAVPTEKAVKTYADTKVALAGNQTVAGVKTFSSAIVGDLTGNVTGDVTGDVTGKADEADGVVETGVGAVTLKSKVIEIGDWNMHADSSVSVTHGLTFTTIRMIGIVIRNDTNTYLYAAPRLSDPATGKLEVGVDIIGETSITLKRLTDGSFDSTAFDSTSFNRGWLTIWYEA